MEISYIDSKLARAFPIHIGHELRALYTCNIGSMNVANVEPSPSRDQHKSLNAKTIVTAVSFDRRNAQTVTVNGNKLQTGIGSDCVTETTDFRPQRRVSTATGVPSFL